MGHNIKEIWLFIKKAIAFMLLFLAIAFLVEITCNLIIKSTANFKLASTPEYAVFGNSRPECAFNDSLIESFINFSESGENYFYTRFKLYKLLSNNPKISTVFIEFGHSNIDNSYKEKLLSINDMSYRYPTFSPFYHYDDYTFFLSNGSNITKNFFALSSVSLRRKVARVALMNFDYTTEMGGYNRLEMAKLDSLLIAFKNIEMEPLSEKDIFTESIMFLKEIIEYCNKHQKNVYIIRCPIHPEYQYYVNEKLISDLLEINFPKIPYLDFSKFPATNSEFSDFTHLNHKGATRFSVWFNELLKNGLLRKDNPQEFIDLEINKLFFDTN